MEVMHHSDQCEVHARLTDIIAFARCTEVDLIDECLHILYMVNHTQVTEMLKLTLSLVRISKQLRDANTF